MGKTFWYFIGIIVVLVLLFVLYLAWPLGSSKEAKAKAAATETAMSQKNLEIAALKEKLQLKNWELDSLAKNCPPKKPVAKSKNQTSGSTPGVQRVIVEIRDLRTGTGASGTVGANNTGAGTGNGTTKSAKILEADYNVSETQAQRANINIIKNPFPLCVGVGEGAETLFWPHLAILDGEEFPEAIDNTHGGYNLSLMPTGTLENIDPNKDYGITEDLISWVRASRLEKWADLPKEIMVSSGNFKPAELYNGLYIAK